VCCSPGSSPAPAKAPSTTLATLAVVKVMSVRPSLSMYPTTKLISGGRLAEVRVLCEALVTACLEHPGIVPLDAAGSCGGGAACSELASGRGRHMLAS